MLVLARTNSLSAKVKGDAPVASASSAEPTRAVRGTKRGIKEVNPNLHSVSDGALTASGREAQLLARQLLGHRPQQEAPQRTQLGTSLDHSSKECNRASCGPTAGSKQEGSNRGRGNSRRPQN